MFGRKIIYINESNIDWEYEYWRLAKEHIPLLTEKYKRDTAEWQAEINKEELPKPKDMIKIQKSYWMLPIDGYGARIIIVSFCGKSLFGKWNAKRAIRKINP